MFLTVIIFILILGVLVLVHEAGHFFVARRNGVRADEFGFGYPPRNFGFYVDNQGKKRFVWGNKEVNKLEERGENTIYSINLIPIGGFVKIHGEDGENKKDEKSFANKSVWKRFKILFAGSGMNLLIGIIFLAVALQMGLPQQIDDSEEVENAEVQIIAVAKNSPAEKAGVKLGDVINFIKIGEEEKLIEGTQQVIDIASANKGEKIILSIKRAGEKDILLKEVELRKDSPEGEGPMGISLARVAEKKVGFFQSFWLAVNNVFFMIVTILLFLGDLIIRIFSSKPVVADVAGPVGIAVLTGQMAKMGLAYLFNFVAILSINLSIINLFPLPALDGGRILFLLIEKIKGSPISQKTEGLIHTVGFFALMALMILVTIKDFINFEIVEKIKGLF